MAWRSASSDFLDERGALEATFDNVKQSEHFRTSILGLERECQSVSAHRSLGSQSLPRVGAISTDLAGLRGAPPCESQAVFRENSIPQLEAV